MSDERRNRRWFRFLLRTMLIGLTVFGGALGWFGLNMRRVQQRDEALYSGRVAVSGIGTYELNPKCRMLPYMWRWLGAQPYYVVELKSDATPAEIARFRDLFPDARIEVHQEHSPSVPNSVRSSDIPKRVQIIGRLGKPLGELVTVQGKWIEGEPTVKDRGPYFHVFHIDGQPLKEPVIFHKGLVESVFPIWKGRPKSPWDWHFAWDGDVPAPEPNDGEQWEVLGVEGSGKLDVMSKEAWDKVDGPAIATPHWASGFYTRLRFIAVRRFENGRP